MEAQQKPEVLKRLQAGVKPLQKRTVTLAPISKTKPRVRHLINVK